MQITGHKEQGAEYYDDVFKGDYRPENRYFLYEYVFELIERLEDPAVLEIGCGMGHLGKMIVDKGYPYRGFDISEEGLRHARQICPEGDFRSANAYDNESYQPQDYNVVVALEVLEHVDDLKVFEKLPAGVMLIASVPDFDDESHLRTYHDVDKDIKERFEPYLKLNGIKIFQGQNSSGNPQTFYVFNGIVKDRNRDGKVAPKKGLILKSTQKSEGSKKLNLGCGRNIMQGG